MESAGPGAYSAPPCSASTSCGTARRSTWGRASADGTDLTREGRRQIEVAAELFAGIRLDLVVASPLRRAMGTAGIIAARPAARKVARPPNGKVRTRRFERATASAFWLSVDAVRSRSIARNEKPKLTTTTTTAPPAARAI